MAVAAALLLGGCLSVPIPQAEADPTRFYLLTPTSMGPAVAPAENAPSVQLLPVEVANYLRSRPMVVRRGENEIQFREFARWGEPLDFGVARVLREELLARGAASHVQVGAGGRAPQAKQSGPAYFLSVRVLACEGAADGSVVFRAAWELLPATPEQGSAVRGDFRPTELRWDGRTEASLAAQLSVAVAGLAGEIAGALKR